MDEEGLKLEVLKKECMVINDHQSSDVAEWLSRVSLTMVEKLRYKKWRDQKECIES